MYTRLHTHMHTDTLKKCRERKHCLHHQVGRSQSNKVLFFIIVLEMEPRTSSILDKSLPQVILPAWHQNSYSSPPTLVCRITWKAWAPPWRSLLSRSELGLKIWHSYRFPGIAAVTGQEPYLRGTTSQVWFSWFCACLTFTKPQAPSTTI